MQIRLSFVMCEQYLDHGPDASAQKLPMRIVQYQLPLARIVLSPQKNLQIAIAQMGGNMMQPCLGYAMPPERKFDQ